MDTPTFARPEQWPFLTVLARLGIATAIGLFVGIEREFSGKLGSRTFGLVAILGCLAGLAGVQFVWMAMAIVLLLLALINWRRLSAHDQLATTTTLSLSIVAFCAVLCGEGHLYTPVLAAILCNSLLAWKQPLRSFTSGLSEKEIRSAILLAALSFIVMPVLPSHPVGPGHLVDPRSNWASVILIAGIAFVNYILLKVVGPRGMELTAFFGGLINSRKVIVEFILRSQSNSRALLPIVCKGVMLATSAMAIRNTIILLALSHSREAMLLTIAPMGLMLLMSIAIWRGSAVPMDSAEVPLLNLDSPFSLTAALQFGLIFLALNVVGALVQRHFGSASFYVVSAAGGLLSSGSSIASAATLIHHGELPPVTGVNGVVISSMTSVLINIPLLRRIEGAGAYSRKLTWSLLGIAAAGVVGVGVNSLWLHWHGL
ncbi:MAG TPA: MgtC/SapB family protein [Acidobacteriaceae bacterium]